MSKVEAYIKKLSAITVQAQEQALLKIIDEHKHLLIDLITGQLLKGVDGNGEFLEAYRDENYAEMKLSLNPLGVTDLRLSGDFWDGFFAKVNKFPLVIDSIDIKRDDLVKRYGEAIFWPGTESKSVFSEFIKKALQEYYKRVYTS